MQRLLPLSLLCALAAQDPGTSYLYRIPGPVPPAAHLLLAQRFDLQCGGRCADGSLEVVVPAAELRQFQALGLNAQLLARGRPYRAIEAEQAGPLAPPDPGYYTVAEVIAEIDRLAGLYPTLATKVDLTRLAGASRTHLGQAIFALKVSDNALAAEDEPAIVIAAQHHARELNSTHMVIGAMQRVLAAYASDPQLKAVVDEHEIYFVPCVNPDGVDHVWNVDNFWRKNRRDNGGGVFGVDNNRNYPTLWGMCGASTVPSSETYRGPAAGSEPENQTMRALGAALRPMLYLDFHSSGREVLFPYAPCASVNPVLRTMLDRYVTDLRTPMNYATRAPSASGEAPEDHWAESGTLSFLVEIGTAFQPPFTETQAEEARVWPGIRRALVVWRPALVGHVRSVFQQTPLAAEISYAPNLFQHGEKIRSRARDGRFAAWLPLGTHQVTFTLPGHAPVTRQVTVASYDTPQVLEIELEPNWAPALLSKTGSDRIGTTTDFQYSSPGDAGDAYWIALSTGTTPGIPLASRIVPLNADGLLIACLTPEAILRGNLGLLPASAQVTASLPIPPIPSLVGLRLWAGGLTLAPGYTGMVKKFSPALALTIQP